MAELRILYQDEHFVAFDKPAGFHTHPHTDPRHRVPQSRNCLAVARDQLGRYVYPVHRLDSATSGVLLFALGPEAASKLAEGFREGLIRKTYVAVTRGWTAEQGLHADDLDDKPSQTRFARIATVELPRPVGRYATSRYSLVRAEPLTGRHHQIRRHFTRASHPLVGDTTYGDGHHNLAMRETLGQAALMLKAYRVDFAHPLTGEPVRIHSLWNGVWQRAFDLFGACPLP
jgi:tRNA pseudouridine65 synthase